MKTHLATLALLMALATPAWAADLNKELADIQTQWAHLKYEVADKDAQVSGLQALETKTQSLIAANPDAAEAKIWRGILLSTEANIVKGLGVLGKVKEAKGLFETAIAQNPNAMGGAAYYMLGTLYDKVPGWPIAFGSSKKAGENLKQAVAMSPNSIDANYFYGEYLMDEGDLKEARQAYERGLAAADRPGQAVADKGRRAEINKALTELAKKEKASRRVGPDN